MQPQVLNGTISAEQILQDLQDPQKNGACVYRNAVIRGALDLRHLIIDRPLEISNCEILDEVDFRYAEFRHTLDLSFSVFRKHFNCGDPTQSHTIFCKDLLAVSAVFHGGATFFGAQFRGSALFTKAQFEDPGQAIIFRGCSFKKYADFDEAVFLGKADFNHIDCGLSLSFIRARFESETALDIWNAKIGNVLDGCGMVVRGGASFERARCRILRLHEASFESRTQPVKLELLCLEGALYCEDAVFEGPVSFNGTQAEGAYLRGARFNNREKGVDFRHACFRVNLHLGSARFQGPVSLESAKIESKLILDNVVFKSEVSFCNTTIDRLELGDYLELAPNSLDMRGCRFESIDEAETLGLRLLWTQASRSFSRDPYIQLEKYLRSVGDDTDADAMYYRGRCALREHARKQDNRIRWSRSTAIGDLILKHLTGYGVKTERVMLPIAALLLVTAFVFLPKSMLESTVENHHEGALVERLFDRAAYSLDLFLPVVDLGICDHWRPKNRWGQVYSFLHVLAGWLLVPLLLASSSGLVRKR